MEGAKVGSLNGLENRGVPRDNGSMPSPSSSFGTLTTQGVASPGKRLVPADNRHVGQDHSVPPFWMVSPGGPGHRLESGRCVLITCMGIDTSAIRHFWLNTRMRIIEITNNVVPFPARKTAGSSVDVPQGYDSFYARDAGPTTAHIMGIRPDGRHVQVSTTTRELANILASAYNRGGTTSVDVKPVSLTQAFGSDAERAFEEMGVRFAEKPDSWAWIKQRASCSADQLWRVGQMIGGLAEVSPEELFVNPLRAHPMASTNDHLPETVVLAMPNGDRFVADRGGSRSYYRMWLYVRPHGMTLVP